MQETLRKILSSADERNLPFLLIGGNAVILYGHPRNTIDLDLLIPQSKRSAWLDLVHGLGFRLHHGTDAFVQLEPASREGAPIDLMLVDERTWELLAARPERREVLGCMRHLPPRAESPKWTGKT